MDVDASAQQLAEIIDADEDPDHGTDHNPDEEPGEWWEFDHAFGTVVLAAPLEEAPCVVPAMPLAGAPHVAAADTMVAVAPDPPVRTVVDAQHMAKGSGVSAGHYRNTNVSPRV